MPTINVTADPEHFEEAVRQFRKRVPMSDAQWEALTLAEREFAFKVSGVAQADLVNDAWTAIDRAIRDGTTLEDFKREVGGQLEAAWGREDPARLETVFRTNTQSAYNGGRHEVMSHPEVKKARPFLRFDAVIDARTSDACDALDGTVRPADDPFWHTHHPPLHFNCRSILTPLTPDEADDEGVTKGPPPADGEPDEGFGRPPTVGGDFEPRPADYPAPIADILRDRLP
jgi:SPP1 gp7 family putative phage head morphogenesis protein